MVLNTMFLGVLRSTCAIPHGVFGGNTMNSTQWTPPWPTGVTEVDVEYVTPGIVFLVKGILTPGWNWLLNKKPQKTFEYLWTGQLSKQIQDGCEEILCDHPHRWLTIWPFSHEQATSFLCAHRKHKSLKHHHKFITDLLQFVTSHAAARGTKDPVATCDAWAH